MYVSVYAELISPCCINGNFFTFLKPLNAEDLLYLYVPLLPAIFMLRHLGHNSLSSLHEAAAPRLAPIAVCAQQQQQQHTVSEPWLAVDVEMGGIMSYYGVICVYLHVMTV